MSPNRRCLFAHLLGCLLALWVAPLAFSQQDNPVYVDDSPQARELFRQAQDQTRDNVSQSVRLYQELLDQYSRKLIRSDNQTTGSFVSVRFRVLRELSRDPALLNRYREVQTAAAAQMLQDGNLADLAMQRSLTDPGLTAMLTLAQREVEAAHFAAARFWLLQTLDHPDLDDDRAAHAWFMLGTAAHYLADTSQFTAALTALQNLGPDHADFALALTQLQQTTDFPKPSVGISTFDRASTDNLDHLVGQPIWSAPLDDSLLNRRFDTSLEGHISQEVYQQHVNEADLNTMCPTVSGDVVYINQGHLISAFNRITGQKVWNYVDLPKVAIVGNDTEPVLDLNTVAISGRSLVTLTGHALGQVRSNNGTVICLDVQTGNLRWVLDRSKLMHGDDMGDMYPYGQPIIADDTVYITARDAGRQQLTTEYVLALNLNDGSLRWSQFVASSARLGLPSRSLTSLVVNDGSVYVASMIGASARIDAATGLIHWLRTFDVPVNAGSQDTGRMPWEIASPIVTADSVISVTPDQKRIVALSRETGEELHSLLFNAAASWSPPRYLLADEHRLYLIGRDLSAISLPGLSAELWRYPEKFTGDTAPAIPPRTLRITGRVQFSDSALIVPSTDDLLFLDPESGREVRQVTLPIVGNPLAIDSQILISGADRLESYMPMDLAQRLLRERIAADPADPQPAMSLLQIARRAHDRDLFIEAADIAVAAINRMASAENTGAEVAKAHQQLLALLIEADTPDLTNDLEFGEKLYARMNGIAVEPVQRIEYLLRHGDWLSHHAVDRAVEQYQVILSDPTLAQTWRQVDGAYCPARISAAQKLSALVAVKGSRIYAAQEDLATRQLQRLLADPAVEPASLEALANEYPLSDAASRAVIQAAKIRIRNNELPAALSALSRASDLITSGPRAADILGAYVQINVNDHRLHDAAYLLHTLSANTRFAAITSNAGPRDPQHWLESLDATAAISREPRLGLESRPVSNIPQRLLEPAIGITGLPIVDRVFTEGEGKVLCLNGESLTTRWSVPIQSALQPPDVLCFDQQGTLLWCGGNSLKGYALMVADNGSVLWTSPVASEVLPPAVAAVRDRNQQMPDGRSFDPTRLFTFANTDQLILLQATGSVAALSRKDGRTVQWSLPKIMDQVYLALATDSLLIVTGRGTPADADPETASLVPLIAVVDARTGKIIDTQQPVNDTGVRWMTLDPLGRLVYGTGGNITSVDAFTLQKRWMNTQPAALETREAWSLENALVVEDRASGLRTLDWNTGRLSPAFDGPTRGEWDPLDLQEIQNVRGNILARFRQRLVAFDARGSVIGADVVNEDRDYRWLIPASDHLLAISARVEPVASDNPSGRRMQYVYFVYNFSDNGKLLDNPSYFQPMLQRVQRVAAIDGWLLLSTESDVFALPLPISPATSTKPAQSAPSTP